MPCLKRLGLFIRPRLLKAAKPLNIIGEESPPLRLTQAFLKALVFIYSIWAIAAFNSSRDNFPDFTASIMDFGEAEILALVPDFLSA